MEAQAEDKKVEDKAEQVKKRICPRCGSPYNWVEKRDKGSNTYYYAVHVTFSKTKRGKKKRHIQKCYLGPERYIYVSHLHQDLPLEFSGLINPQRYAEYLEALRNAVKTQETGGT